MPLCAVAAMQEYFLLVRPRHGPLFYFASGRYLTRGIVSDLLRDSARVAGLPYQSLQTCKPILLSDPARAVLHSARSAGEISEVLWSRHRRKSH